MQTVNLSNGKASFTITGPDVEPLSDSWRRATPDQRRAYWPILARWVRDAKLKSLEGGEDARGDALTPPTNPLSREWYRITGREWRGPSMSPQNGRSRTQRYLAVEPFPGGKPDRIVGFWRGGFARILNYHALGIAGRGRPYFDDAGRMRGWAGIPGATTGIVRDVVGLSPGWTQWAVNSARNEWERSVGARIAARPAMPMPARQPTIPSPVDRYAEVLAEFRPSSPIIPGVRGRPAMVPQTRPRSSAIRRAFLAVSDFFRRIGGIFR